MHVCDVCKVTYSKYLTCRECNNKAAFSEDGFRSVCDNKSCDCRDQFHKVFSLRLKDNTIRKKYILAKLCC